MSMRANDMAGPRGEAIKLAIGEKIAGAVEAVGEFREIDGKFGKSIQAPITVVIDGENKTLWVKKGSRLASVIADAIRAAGVEELKEGGRLQVARIEDKPTDKGNPMHDFAAKYTPPVTAGSSVSASDLFD